MSKKTFKTVATTFFSEATKEQEKPKPAVQRKADKPATGKQGKAKPQPAVKVAEQETKVRRVQLLFKPSTHELAKEAAYKARLSLNAYINKLLEEHLK